MKYEELATAVNKFLLVVSQGKIFGSGISQVKVFCRGLIKCLEEGTPILQVSMDVRPLWVGLVQTFSKTHS